MFGLGEFLVFADGEPGAEEEVLKGVFVEDAVHDDLALRDFEVEAPVRRAEAVEGLAVAVQAAEALVLEVLEIVLGDAEGVEEFQLLEGLELGDLRGADDVEDDLEHGGDSNREIRRWKTPFYGSSFAKTPVAALTPIFWFFA